MRTNQVQAAAESARTTNDRPMPTGRAEEVAVLTLDERGMMRDCNRGGELLFKYRRGELVWRHISMLLPQLANMELLPHGEPNPRLRYFCHIGGQLEAVAQDGEHFACVIYLNLLENAAEHGPLVLIVRPAEEADDS
jgi:hypothetical protein